MAKIFLSKDIVCRYNVGPMKKGKYKKDRKRRTKDFSLFPLSPFFLFTPSIGAGGSPAGSR